MSHASSSFVCRLLAFLLTVAALASVVRAVDPSGSMEGVIDFTAATFDEQVGKSKPALVEFYAPWCGHCKSMAPEMEKLGRVVASAQGQVLVGKVDGTQQRELTGRFSITGYPTILFFPAGSLQPETYSDGREVESFVKFLNNRVAGLRLALPQEHTYATEISGNDFRANVLDPTKDALVMFYAPWCGHCKNLHPIYERLAEVYLPETDLVIAKVNAVDTANRATTSGYKIDGYPTIAFFPKDKKEEPKYYDGARDLESLVSYVNKEANKQRLSSGDLSQEVGIHNEASKLLRDMIADGKSEEEKQKLLADVKKAVADVFGHAAVQYPRIAEKLMTVGAEYVDKELGRIGRLKTSSLKASARDVLTIRSNILASLKN